MADFVRKFAANTLSYTLNIDRSGSTPIVTVVVDEKKCKVYIPDVKSTVEGSLAPMVVSNFQCEDK